MKLFLLKRIKKEDDLEYDCSDGFVVRAPSEARARTMISENGGLEGTYGDEGPEVWLARDGSTCEEIAVEGPEEIILRDFWAG